MQIVPSRHPPGAVVFATNEVGRYANAFLALEELQVPPGSARFWRQGAMVSRNLNSAIRDAMNAHVDMPRAIPDPLKWIWIMGDDHFYRHDTLLRLLDRRSEEADVVAPLVLNRAPPFWPTVHGGDGKVKPLSTFPTQGFYHLTESETCGDAGLLVPREVLEALGDPWFDRPACGGLAADDQLFTGRIRKLGFRVAIDVEVQIGHTTPADIVPVIHGGVWKARISACQRSFALVDMRDEEQEGRA